VTATAFVAGVDILAGIGIDIQDADAVAVIVLAIVIETAVSVGSHIVGCGQGTLDC
jgi:hypothetical protein